MLELAWIGALALAVVLFAWARHWATRSSRIAASGLVRAALERGAGRRVPALLSGCGLALAAPGGTSWTRSALSFVDTGFIDTRAGTGMAISTSLSAVIVGWVVVLMGVSPDAAIVAASVALVGLALNRIPGRERRRELGGTLVGWGAALLAIELLGLSFQNLEGKFRLDAIGLGLGTRLFVYAFLATLASVVSRAPGLVVCVTMFATATGALGLTTGVACMMGVQLGYLVPAVDALLKGSAPARRVAIAFASFQGIVAIVGLLFVTSSLPWLVSLSGELRGPFLALAAFHTIVVMLSLAIFMSVSVPIHSWADGRYLELEQDPKSAPGLDPSIASVPDLAHAALLQGLTRMAEIPPRLGATLLRGETPSKYRRKESSVAIAHWTIELENGAQSVSVRGASHELALAIDAVPAAARALSDLFHHISALPPRPVESVRGQSELAERVQRLQTAVTSFIERVMPVDADGLVWIPEALVDLEAAYAEIEQYGQYLERWARQWANNPNTERLVERCSLVRTVAYAAMMVARTGHAAIGPELHPVPVDGHVAADAA